MRLEVDQVKKYSLIVPVIGKVWSHIELPIAVSVPPHGVAYGIPRGYIVSEASHHRITTIACSDKERLTEQPASCTSMSAEALSYKATCQFLFQPI